MRKINIYIFLASFVLLFSCKKTYEGLNTSPNGAAEVPVNAVLGGIEGTIAYVYWGDASRYLSLYTQHVDGISRQFTTYHNYGLQPGDVNTLYSNMYANVLKELDLLEKNAVKEGYGHYTGIAKVLKAYSLMMLTDYFGDIPWSDALQGTSNIQPTFDTQEAIYGTIESLLISAKTDFLGSDGGFPPGADDFIFSGDVTKWAQFANFIEARAYLHLAKVDAGNYAKAIASIKAGGLDEDAFFPFTSSPFHAPWNQYNEQRGDIGLGLNFKAMLTGLSDPRLAKFDPEGDGTIPEDHPVFTADQKGLLGGPTEQHFILAEAYLGTGNSAKAYIHYQEGITGSMAELGIAAADVTAYIAQPSVVPSEAALTMTHVMTQKHIAMFVNPESFTDWRRTGIPSLTPNSGNEVPIRFPYPSDVRNLNTNTPSSTQFTPVWWDK